MCEQYFYIKKDLFLFEMLGRGVRNASQLLSAVDRLDNIGKFQPTSEITSLVQICVFANRENQPETSKGLQDR